MPVLASPLLPISRYASVVLPAADTSAKNGTFIAALVDTEAQDLERFVHKTSASRLSKGMLRSLIIGLIDLHQRCALHQSRRESSRMLILHLALFQLQLLHRRVGCQRIENHRRRVSKGVERQLQRRQRARFERDRRCQMVDLVSDMPMYVKLSSTARV